MNKQEFIDFVAEKQDMTKTEAKKATDVFLNGIYQALESGEENIQLTGYFNIEVRHVEEHSKGNPQEYALAKAEKRPAKLTVIPAHGVVKVTVGKTLQDLVK